MPRHRRGADSIALRPEIDEPQRPSVSRVVCTFLAVWVPMLVWSFATPLNAAPDEADHVRFAASVVRGADIEPVPDDDDDWDDQLATQLALRGVTSDALLAEAWGTVTLPAFYGQDSFGCFAFQPNQTADCQVLDELPGDASMVLASRFYPKSYYAIVGWPSLMTEGRIAVHGMRAVSAALCAAFCTFAILVALRRRPFHSVTVLGVLAAITPMVWFLSGSVNPNAVEIAAALATWVGLATLLDDQAHISTLPARGVLAGTALAGATVGVIRPISAFWLAVIAGIFALGTRRAQLGRLIGRRQVQVAIAAVAIVTGAQTLATMANGSLSGVDPRTAQHALDGWAVLRTTIGRQGAMVEQLVGQLGWLDTPLPFAVLLGWYTIVGALVGLALVHGDRRQLVGLGSLIAACFVVPVVLEAQAVNAVGFLWQGRYTLPMAVGVPVLAARAVGPALLGTRRAGALTVAVIAVTTGGSILALYTSLRRYAVGLSGPLAIWDDPSWNPPATVLVLLMAGVVAHAAAGWWFLRLARPVEAPPT